MIPTLTHSTRIRLASLFVALLACTMASTGFARSTLIIRGADGALEENVRLMVAQPPERENTRQFNRYMDGLPEQVISALSAFGYYAAQVDVSVESVAPPAPENAAKKAAGKIGDAISGKEADAPSAAAVDPSANAKPETITQVTVDITLNDPVRITELNLRIKPPVSATPSESDDASVNADDAEAQDILRTAADFADVDSQIRQSLAEGSVFVSASYEAAKSTLLSRAQDLGYFDFEFERTEVRVSRRNGTAEITLIATPGQRYDFGDIVFEQRTFSETFMNRWAPFKPGDPYEAQLIGELTQNLQSSGYFASVRVRPLIDPRYEQTVPVKVDLTQRDENQVALGIGYSTDTRLRTKLTWGKPLINSNGHSAEWSASLSREKQSASFSYRVPRSKKPLFNYWGFEYGLKREENDDSKSVLSTVNLQRVSRTPRDWTESLFIRWERERFEAGGVEDTTDLLLPGISYSRSRSKGEPFSTWGQSLSFQLMGGSKSALSSIDFLKTLGRFRYLRAVSDRNTLIGTVQYGVIQSNDYDRVPLSQRFFAGGDRTVRGYAFRDLSPRNPEGDAVGGRFLEVLSLEYNYRFRDRWSGALFADAGRAFNSFDTGYSVGAGFGVRWQSPVGPFRIDIATPVSDNETGGVRVHLSLGPDL